MDLNTRSYWIILALLVLSVGAAAGEAKVKELKTPIGLNGSFVPVNLSSRANSELKVNFPANTISVNGIPFLIPESKSGNNVFLKDAGWANWQKDPSSYYSPYDCMYKVNSERRFLFSVPVVDYSGIWLLAATDDDKAYSETVSFRIGSLSRSPVFDQVKYLDFESTVPRFNAKAGRSPFIKTGIGNLYLVHVPIGKAFAQDFSHKFLLDVDVTQKLRLALRRPDPCRYQIRPLGLPSGVHIFGMTFQISPFQMKVTGTEPGNVFVAPDTAEFNIAISMFGNQSYRYRGRDVYLEAVATDYYGNATTTKEPVSLSPDDRKAVGLKDSVKTRFKVNCPIYGYYNVTIRLKSGRAVLASRETTLACLPPDTRKHRDECPLGTWSFEKTHFNIYDPDLIGSLHYKAGLRYGMFGYPESIRKKYNVIKGTDSKSDLRKEAGVRRMKEMITNPDEAKVERFLIFHETAISGNHVQRVPAMFTGKQYKLDEKEKKKFEDLWNQAEVNAKKIKELNPLVEIYFGNGSAMFLEEFLKHKFPKELLCSRGNEAGSFMRMPESQPLDIIANNSSLWIDRKLLDHYGYTDTPLRQCYEMCYPCTNPGNLSPATQAKYFIRSSSCRKGVWPVKHMKMFVMTRKRSQVSQLSVFRSRTRSG